jgi:filamentous hemagglutinin
MNSDYQAVTDQSGFFAGKGGYTIDVAKNTTLQGGNRGQTTFCI